MRHFLLSSWGVTVNPSYDKNTPGAKSPFIIVRKQSNKFSEKGDSSMIKTMPK